MKRQDKENSEAIAAYTVTDVLKTEYIYKHTGIIKDDAFYSYATNLIYMQGEWYRTEESAIRAAEIEKSGHIDRLLRSAKHYQQMEIKIKELTMNNKGELEGVQLPKSIIV